MEVIIVVARNREEQFRSSWRSLESLRRSLPAGQSCHQWTLRTSVQNNISHIMGGLKFLFDGQFTIHQGFLLQVQEEDNGVLFRNILCKMSK